MNLVEVSRRGYRRRSSASLRSWTSAQTRMAAGDAAGRLAGDALAIADRSGYQRMSQLADKVVRASQQLGGWVSASRPAWAERRRRCRAAGPFHDHHPWLGSKTLIPGGALRTDVDEGPARFAEVLRTRAFAVLYGAETQSLIGDQLARVALSVLVFDQTGSVVATALTYAATLLPAVLGGYVLAGIGDRLPRRAVLIGCDFTRAGLFALMALPALPLGYVIGLLVVAVFIGPAFSASEVSLLASLLGEERFRAATGIRMVTNQSAQVVGFAVGGVLVSWLHPRGALLVDAATYLASALLIMLLLRGFGSGRSTTSTSQEPDRKQAFAGLWADSRLRALIGLSALAGFFIVPEGLAVPFASRIGQGTTQAGFLLAALPLGGAIGAGLLVRIVPRRQRTRAAGLMAVACGLPLMVSAAHPAWPIAWVTWLISGLFAAYQVEVVTSLVHAIPDELRSRSLGIVGAWLIGAQGAGLAAFGAVARPVGVGWTIATAGLIGSALALLLVVGPLRHWRDDGDVVDPRGRHRVPPTAPTTAAHSAQAVDPRAGG